MKSLVRFGSLSKSGWFASRLKPCLHMRFFLMIFCTCIYTLQEAWQGRKGIHWFACLIWFWTIILGWNFQMIIIIYLLSYNLLGHSSFFVYKHHSLITPHSFQFLSAYTYYLEPFLIIITFKSAIKTDPLSIKTWPKVVHNLWTSYSCVRHSLGTFTVKFIWNVCKNLGCSLSSE